MPDFTKVVHFHCRSVEDYETTVKGSSGRSYRVWVGYCAQPHSVKFDWHCECKGFQFRKTCKHIDAAKATGDYCGWHQMIGGEEIVRDEDNVARCPECGDIAIAMEYAV